MKILKIEKKGRKYKITLDNGEIIDTFDEVILKNNLLYDKTIDANLLNKINEDTVYYHNYNKVVQMISRKLRSEHEVWEYLLKNGILESDAIKLIDNLKKNGLIDDVRFARAYINDKFNLTMDGPYKIASDLEEHKIDSHLIQQLIGDVPLEVIDERLDKIVMKRVKNNKRFSAYLLKQKTIMYLISLGYNRNDIERHLDKITSDKTILAKEMDRVYKKLALKYSGDEFRVQLKNKLYSRGFKMEDINEYIEKKQF